MSNLCAKKLCCSKGNKRMYLVNGVESCGRTAWYYVELDGLKEAIFTKKCTTDKNLNINEYGKIVASGWGDTPPDDVRKKFE